MNQDIGEFSVYKHTERAFMRNRCPGRLVATDTITNERSYRCPTGTDVTNAEQETAKTFLPDRRVHSMGIVPAGSGKAELVMGMPFPDVMETIAVLQQPSDLDEIFYVLVKECTLVVGSRTWSDSIHHYWYAGRGPVAKKLSAGLDVRIVQNTTVKVIQFRLEYYCFASPADSLNDSLVITVAPDFKHPHQVLASGVKLFLLYFRCFH